MKPKPRCPKHSWRWEPLRTTPFSTEYARRCQNCKKQEGICTGTPWSRCKCGFHDGSAGQQAGIAEKLAGIEEKS